MKPILIFTLIITSILFSCSNEYTDRSDAEKMGLKGKPYKVVESVHSVEDIFGVIEKKKLIRQTSYVFNQDGEIIKEKVFSAYDSTTFFYSFKFDSLGNRIEKTKYDNIGNIKKKLVFSYDNDGILLKKHTYDSDIENNTVEVFDSYNSGRVFIKDGYFNKLSHQYHQKFNDYQDVIEKKETFIDVELNDCVDLQLYDYTYDDYGNIITELYTSNTNCTNAVDSLTFTSTSTSYYKYRYDQKNSWIEKIGYYNEFPKRLYSREIEYYDETNLRLKNNHSTNINDENQTYEVDIANGFIEDCNDCIRKRVNYRYQTTRLDINVGGNTDIMLKVIDFEDNSCIAFVYVNSNSTYSIEDIPQGKYYLKIAYGSNFIINPEDGICYGRFSENSSYQIGLDTLDYNLIRSSDELLFPIFELSLDVISTNPINSFNSTNILEEEFYN